MRQCDQIFATLLFWIYICNLKKCQNIRSYKKLLFHEYQRYIYFQKFFFWAKDHGNKTTQFCKIAIINKNEISAKFMTSCFGRQHLMLMVPFQFSPTLELDHCAPYGFSDGIYIRLESLCAGIAIDIWAFQLTFSLSRWTTSAS